MAAALESYVTESVALLLVVALVVVVVSLAARRAGLGRALGPIELLARLPLEQRRSVYVVRVVDQLLIIGCSEAGLVKLGELPKGALPDSGGGHEATFASLLEGVWHGASPGRRTAASGEGEGEGEKQMPRRSGAT